MYTAISRKVVRKNVHTTTPKGNMGYDQYTVPNDYSCRTYFCCFPFALANICPWPLVPFFQISLENRADKTTHNTFRDCRVHFFRQPFSKQLYRLCTVPIAYHWSSSVDLQFFGNDFVQQCVKEMEKRVNRNAAAPFKTPK